MKLNRRQALLAASVSAFACLLDGRLVRAAAGSGQIEFGPAQPFDFEWLKAQAKALADQPYQEPVIRHADILETIDYDAFQQIRFKPERALWEDGGAPFPVQFFHLGRYSKLPVSLYEVADGQAREILYATDFFSFGKTGLDRKLPGDLGFAGFRVMDGHGLKTDWLAYQGAAYFRTSGELDQYGLSARGLAIDTAMPWPEEFPRFTRFWLERTPEDSAHIIIYALMDGPSVAGAYRFDWTKDTRRGRGHPGRAVLPQPDHAHGRGAAHQHVLVRREQPAPGDRLAARDPRHRRARDLDRRRRAHLAAAQQSAAVQTSSFSDSDPKGFGLIQRDRAFYDYEDDGVFYDRRPSVWVEPQGDWGNGAVQLVEIPTDDEIHDNIVAYWVPATPVAAGSQWSFAYRLHWLADEPYPPTAVARVRHTRLGRGGIPGQPRPAGARKFVIDFEGGPLERAEEARPGQAGGQCLARPDRQRLRVADRGHPQLARVLRPVRGRAGAGRPALLPAPGRRTLTETWLYQYIPFEYARG